ncbi:MAG TPA: hypothetical protein VMM77_01085 [Gemmatimonadaceae bacterium]|nr:hypothetical protein [Gemmatimonadaceae bacterium]
MSALQAMEDRPNDPNGRATRRRRTGVALAVAVVALAVIGALVAAAHATGVRSHLAGERRFLQTEALAAAEYGVERVAANAPLAVWRAMPPGSTDSAGPWVVGRARVKVRMTRLGDSLHPIVLLQGVATAGGGTGRVARRTISLTLSVGQGRFTPLGALTTGAPVAFGPGALIEGADLPPAGWSCPVGGAPLPGISTPSAGSVLSAGCGAGCLGGAPPVAQSAMAADTSTYQTFGELTWAQLTATARRIPAVASPRPSTSANVCLATDPLNWGDPARASPAAPCESYFPVLYAAGDLHLAGGVGQGILLVGGNLTVGGGARFAGIVVTQGTVDAGSGGGRLEGAVMAAGATGGTNRLVAPLTIVHSRCAIAAAESGGERVLPVPHRAWADVY